MPLPSYIAKSRHGIYYLRVVTPRAVLQANPNFPKDIRKSLKTRCPREAVARSRGMALDWQFIFTEVAKNMKNSDDDNYNSKLIVDVLPGGGVRYQFEEGDTADRTKEYIAMLREAGVIPASAGVMAELGHSQPTASEFREAKLAVKDIKPGGAWLSEIIEAFAIEKLQEKQWTENTWTRTYQPLLRDFREIVSNEKQTFTDKTGAYQTIWDIRARELAEEHIALYCDAMWKFPKNYGSIKDVGDAKQALKSGLPAQDRSNAFKKIRMVRTFLKWAYKKKKLSQELDELLPVERLDKKRDKSKDGYQPFTDRELKLIFEAPTYPMEPGWKYWTPLLGLYTGGRANELAQLLVSDVITTKSGIPCIVITDLYEEDDDAPFDISTPHLKNVKTASSRRWVPIHPKLVEVGFLNFVENLKEKGETKLFPDLPYVVESGYGRKVSRNFAETTKKLGIWVERKKVFHSFRSTLNGRLLKLGMPQELREFVFGHKNESVNVESYAKQLADRPYELFYEWIEKADFGISPKTWMPLDLLPNF